MQLVIVESPTKARTLSRFLGDDYIVEATTGHIKDLPKSKLGVDIEKNFEPQYEVVPKRKETIESLKRKAKGVKQIFLATDPDREGEAIASHVKDVLANSKIQNPNDKFKRIVFHEITKEAVEEAIANPRAIDKNLVDAQTARRVLDRLVGYSLSPLLWRKIRRGLSAGRVQTVTVRLIVEREREIEAFKSEEYWEIFCTVIQLDSQTAGQFVVQLIKIGEKKAEVNNEKDAKLIVAELKAAKYKVLSVDKHEVKKNPYLPFTTSTMTQAGARVLGWSAKRTMQIAQKLYEEGLITYHRTDSTFLSSQAVDKTRNFIAEKYGEKYLPEKPRFFKTTSKVAQEAHEAIRPTDVSMNYELGITNYGADQKKLYELIWRRFVACQMAVSIYDETTIEVEALGNRKKAIGKNTSAQSLVPNAYLLRASGQIMKFDGWRKLFAVDSSLSAVDQAVLPEVRTGEALDLIKVDPQQKFTEPPARYNEASLIKTLEKLGIGRPSTYAPTISTIQVRQYVEKEEGKFTPTPVGFAVNDFLIKYFPDIFEYAFTAEMEDNLDHIANGKVAWEAPIKDFWDPFSKKLEKVTETSKRVKIEVEKLGKSCPECKKGELVIRIGRFGKFISCSRFPDCKYTEKYIEKVGIKCPECKEGDVIIKKSFRGGKRFFGCSRYPDCKWASWKSPKMESELPSGAPKSDK